MFCHLYRAGHSDAPPSPGQLAQPVTKVWQRLGGPVDACAVNRKAQKPVLSGGADRPLGLVNLQLEVLPEKAGETAFDALVRSSAFDHAQDVITEVGEEMPPPV